MLQILLNLMFMDKFLSITFFSAYIIGVISFFAFLWFNHKRDYDKKMIAVNIIMYCFAFIVQDWFLSWLWPKWGWTVNQVCLTAFFVMFICFALAWGLSVYGRVKGGAQKLAKYTHRIFELGAMAFIDVIVCFICMFF